MAVRKLDADVTATRWFILIGGFALAVLTVSFLVFTFKQRSRRLKSAVNHSAKHDARPDRDNR
jgi:hypothetical protein